MLSNTGFKQRSLAMEKGKNKLIWHIICFRAPPMISSLGNYALTTALNLAHRGYKVYFWTSKLNDEISKNNPSNFTLQSLDDAENSPYTENLSHILENDKQHGKVLWYYEPNTNKEFCQKLKIWASKKPKNTSFSLIIHKPLESSYTFSSLKNLYSYLKEKHLLKDLLGSVNEVFITAPYLKEKIKKLLRKEKKLPIHWLPLQSNIKYIKDEERAQNIRKAFAPESQFLLGSFGSYHDKPQVKELNKQIFLLLNKHPERFFLCLGRNSSDFVAKFKKFYPYLEAQIEATGELDYPAVSAHIQACDIMIQPYPNGITAKNTSLLTSLSHEKAILTTKGPRTESFWLNKNCLSLYEENSELDFLEKFDSIIYDSSIKKSLEKKAGQTYKNFFSPNKTIQKLLSL